MGEKLSEGDHDIVMLQEVGFNWTSSIMFYLITVAKFCSI